MTTRIIIVRSYREYPCPYCGRLMKRRIKGKPVRRETETRDHIVPRCMGGSDAGENLRAVCYECNQLRALAGHCIGALACARARASRTTRLRKVLRKWQLGSAVAVSPEPQ